MSTKVIERQTNLSGFATTGIANIGVGNELLIDLPPNALLLAVDVFSTVLFDAGTSAALTVSDGTTTFAAGVDVKNGLGSKVVANVPKFYPSGGTLTISLAQVGTSTVGTAFVVARFVVQNRGGEVYSA